MSFERHVPPAYEVSTVLGLTDSLDVWKPLTTVENVSLQVGGVEAVSHPQALVDPKAVLEGVSPFDNYGSYHA